MKRGVVFFVLFLFSIIFGIISFPGVLATHLYGVGHVNLELRPTQTNWQVGQIVEVGIYAVSEDYDTKRFAASEIILTWDRNVLLLLNSVPAHSWMAEGFLRDADGINEHLDDGDAYHIALGSPFDIPTASRNGLLISVLRFRALAPSSSTQIRIEPFRGRYSQTTVVDDQISGLPITGTLREAAVNIAPSSGSQTICGNGLREGTEVCDRDDLAGRICLMFGSPPFEAGTLRCKADCSGFDTSACAYLPRELPRHADAACGDGIVTPSIGEVCDGSSVGQVTCSSLGFTSGTLRCSSSCRAFDTSECISAVQPTPTPAPIPTTTTTPPSQPAPATTPSPTPSTTTPAPVPGSTPPATTTPPSTPTSPETQPEIQTTQSNAIVRILSAIRGFFRGLFP